MKEGRTDQEVLELLYVEAYRRGAVWVSVSVREHPVC